LTFFWKKSDIKSKRYRDFKKPHETPLENLLTAGRDDSCAGSVWKNQGRPGGATCVDSEVLNFLIYQRLKLETGERREGNGLQNRD
jgi:hypothetical protein